MCLFFTSMSSLEKCVFLCPFKELSCLSFYYSVVRVLCLFWILDLYYLYDLQVFFFHSIGCLFIFKKRFVYFLHMGFL